MRINSERIESLNVDDKQQIGIQGGNGSQSQYTGVSKPQANANGAQQYTLNLDMQTKTTQGYNFRAKKKSLDK